MFSYTLPYIITLFRIIKFGILQMDEGTMVEFEFELLQ